MIGDPRMRNFSNPPGTLGSGPEAVSLARRERHERAFWSLAKA
jgi:hypothetical protein